MAGRFKDPTIYQVEDGALWQRVGGLNKPLTWESIEEYIDWLHKSMVWDTPEEQEEWERAMDEMRARINERNAQ